MIGAKVTLTQPNRPLRQFVATTGSRHHLLLDDIAGGTGPKPIELLAVGLAGCTASDVITYLRHKRHQDVTGYEVRVEAEQAEKPPQVFTAVRVHHIVAGNAIDPRSCPGRSTGRRHSPFGPASWRSIPATRAL